MSDLTLVPPVATIRMEWQKMVVLKLEMAKNGKDLLEG